MGRANKRKRRLSCVLPTALLFLTIAAVTTVTIRQIRQAHLNDDLIAAINRYDPITYKYDVPTALRLLDQGADPNTRSLPDDNSDPFHAAIAQWFRRSADRAPKGPCALEIAINRHEQTLISALLSHGADPNTKDAEGTSLLVYASLCGDDESVVRLLKLGARDVNGRNPEPNWGGYGGEPPMDWNRCREPILCWAVEENHPDIVRMLLDRGADVNISDDNGRTPLLWAARTCWNSDSTMRLLLARGANVNARDCKGYTALAVARKMRMDPPFNDDSDTIIALLKQAGAKE